MNKKTWILLICVVLVVIITVVAIVGSNKKDISGSLGVQRDESVDVGPIIDRFVDNADSIKDDIKKEE